MCQDAWTFIVCVVYVSGFVSRLCGIMGVMFWCWFRCQFLLRYVCKTRRVGAYFRCQLFFGRAFAYCLFGLSGVDSFCRHGWLRDFIIACAAFGFKRFFVPKRLYHWWICMMRIMRFFVGFIGMIQQIVNDLKRPWRRRGWEWSHCEQGRGEGQGWDWVHPGERGYWRFRLNMHCHGWVMRKCSMRRICVFPCSVFGWHACILFLFAFAGFAFAMHMQFAFVWVSASRFAMSDARTQFRVLLMFVACLQPEEHSMIFSMSICVRMFVMLHACAQRACVCLALVLHLVARSVAIARLQLVLRLAFPRFISCFVVCSCFTSCRLLCIAFRRHLLCSALRCLSRFASRVCCCTCCAFCDVAFLIGVDVCVLSVSFTGFHLPLRLLDFACFHLQVFICMLRICDFAILHSLKILYRL